MANEATVFSLSTTNGALATSNEVDVGVIDVATANAAAVPADIDFGIYILKTKYEGIIDGRSKLLRQLELFKAKIIKGAWPAV